MSWWRSHVLASRARAFWLASLACAVVVMCGWAIASPPGSSPDEEFHLPSIWCAQGLEACGFHDFVFELGHRDFAVGYSGMQQQQISEGDFAGLGFVPDMIPIATLASDNPLYAVAQKLSPEIAAKTQVNMALMHGIEQYTGMIFRCYLAGTRFPIACGGRYDVLLSKFGYDQPAVGFAFDLALLQRAMETRR